MSRTSKWHQLKTNDILGGACLKPQVCRLQQGCLHAVWQCISKCLGALAIGRASQQQHSCLVLLRTWVGARQLQPKQDSISTQTRQCCGQQPLRQHAATEGSTACSSPACMSQQTHATSSQPHTLQQQCPTHKLPFGGRPTGARLVLNTAAPHA